MKITVGRFSTSKESTIGALYIDDVFHCYVLEDTQRPTKVAGETRIPAGEYEVDLRTEGGMTQRYAERYPDIHQGMIWLRDVPGFEYVYIHVGNKNEHTEGCLLVGDQANNNQIENGFVGNSSRAYRRIYQKIAGAIEQGEMVRLKIAEIG